MSVIAAGKSDVVCGQIDAEICDSIDNRFVTEEDIKAMVLDKYPQVLGHSLKLLDAEKMETFLKKHPAIKNCEVFFTYDGSLQVKVHQRRPIVRVFDEKKSYYLDEQGERMPVFKNYTAHITVANGNFSKLKNEQELFLLANYIFQNSFWKAQIEQIYIDSKGEFILIPRVGDHRIIFGDLSRMEIKFRNLKALYTNGWEAREWNLYKAVNLKYNGQVVCTKGN